jgi:DNA polymerase-4
MILHIDMDAFFASVEQAINPTLKGQPLIVGSRDNKYHTVVCAASYEAKRLGIDSGMNTKEAFLICPQAKFIPADSAKYLYVSNQIFQMLKIYPCDIGYSSIDEFDLEFGAHQKIDHIAIAKDIKQLIRNTFGISCSIGIAPNWHLAKLGSKIGKPDGLTIIDQSNYLDILSRTPIEKVCGIGPALTNQLNNLGIKTCCQLIKYPRQNLVNKFGKIGHWLADCLNPQCQETHKNQDTGNPPKSIGHSYTLPKETSNPKIILSWIRLLSEMVAQRLRKSGLEAKTIKVWVSHAENRGFSRQKTFQSSISHGHNIFMRSMTILGLKNGQKMSLRAIGIEVSGLHTRTRTLLLEKERNEENLARFMDKINDRYGDWTIYPATIALIHNSPNPQR